MIARALCLAALVAAVVPQTPAIAQGDGERMEQTTAELERVRARLQALKKDVDRDRSRRGKLFRELEATETKVSELSQTLAGK